MDELVERSPGYGQARVLLARMLIADGAFEAAERHLRRLQRDRPQ